MKKGTMIALIVAGALIVTGFVLAAVSFAIGSGVMEVINATNIVFGDDGEEANTGEIFNGKTYIIDEKINSIDVDWSSGSVKVLPSPDGKLSFSEDAGSDIKSRDALRYEINNGVLKIAYYTPRNGIRIGIFGIGFTPDVSGKTLTLYVPEELMSIKIDVASAGVELSDINARRFSIHAASGDIALTSCCAEKSELSTASGKMNLSGRYGDVDLSSASGKVIFSGIANEFDADTASGAVEAAFEEMPREIEVDTASGRVELDLPEGAAFQLEFDSASGKLDCAFPTVKKDDAYYAGENGALINIDTASGDLIIK